MPCRRSPLEKDGVDGSKIYLYGEGFNFGDTANNQIGPNASQVNLYGFGIGTFNDRIRDGIRGGSPFTDERVQGFATGLFTDPEHLHQWQPVLEPAAVPVAAILRLDRHRTHRQSARLHVCR